MKKQIVNIAEEHFTDYSFLSILKYNKSKNYLRRQYQIRHWIPMFIGTPFTVYNAPKTLINWPPYMSLFSMLWMKKLRFECIVYMKQIKSIIKYQLYTFRSKNYQYLDFTRLIINSEFSGYLLLSSLFEKWLNSDNNRNKPKFLRVLRDIVVFR